MKKKILDRVSKREQGKKGKKFRVRGKINRLKRLSNRGTE